MPIVWNDIHLMMVDNDVKYIPRDYVVVRKLFVQQNMVGNRSKYIYNLRSQCYGEAIVRKEFQQFGDIESIELLENGKLEAYVTFKSDSSALSALLHIMENGKTSEFISQPADTWEQPLEKATVLEHLMEVDGEEKEIALPPIFSLNEDCLVMIFKCVDLKTLVKLSDVCKLFKDVLERRLFPRIQFFQIDDYKMTLAEIRRELRLVGQHIRILKVKFNFLHNKRLLQKLNQYVGENIRDLHICIGEMTADHIPFIENIFRRLDSLTFDSWISYDVDFKSLCPNLTKLRLEGKIALKKYSKKYPKLKHFTFCPVQPEPFPAIFHSIIAENPQLECVKAFGNNISSATVPFLSNVQKISIYHPVADNLIHLSELQYLTKLTLCDLRVSELRYAFHHLATLVKLRDLKIFASNGMNDNDTKFEDYQMPMIVIARQLTCLENIILKGLKLVKATIFDFVRFAVTLKSFHIHKCHIFPSTEKNSEEISGVMLITDIVEARKWIRNKEAKLRLYLDPREKQRDSDIIRRLDAMLY